MFLVICIYSTMLLILTVPAPVILAIDNVFFKLNGVYKILFVFSTGIYPEAPLTANIVSNVAWVGFAITLLIKLLNR